MSEKEVGADSELPGRIEQLGQRGPAIQCLPRLLGLQREISSCEVGTVRRGHPKIGRTLTQQAPMWRRKLPDLVELLGAPLCGLGRRTGLKGISGSAALALEMPQEIPFGRERAIRNQGVGMGIPIPCISTEGLQRDSAAGLH